RRAIAEADGEGLKARLEDARAAREQLPRHRKGILSAVYELVVQVADEPGAIHAVTGCLAAQGINIKDIEILRVREGEGGTLRLPLEGEADLETASREPNGAGCPRAGEVNGEDSRSSWSRRTRSDRGSLSPWTGPRARARARWPAGWRRR